MLKFIFIHQLSLKSDRLEIDLHSGTHMDAPRHFSQDKWTIEQVPLDRLVNVPARVIDLSEKCKRYLFPYILMLYYVVADSQRYSFPFLSCLPFPLLMFIVFQQPGIRIHKRRHNSIREAHSNGNSEKVSCKYLVQIVSLLYIVKDKTNSVT